MHYPHNNMLRISLYLKLFFIIVELLLVIMCGVAMYHDAWAVSVVGEWIIGLFFTFYMWSCSIDFLTTPDLGLGSGKMRLRKSDWDKEAGLSVPEKA